MRRAVELKPGTPRWRDGSNQTSDNEGTVDDDDNNFPNDDTDP